MAQLTQGCVGGGSEMPEIPFKNETKLHSARVVKHRNEFPEGAVGHTPLEADKTPPDQQLTQVGGRDRTRWSPDMPSNLYHAVIL